MLSLLGPAATPPAAQPPAPEAPRTAPGLTAILGGLGPVATARLHAAIIERALAGGAVEDADFPPLLIASAAGAGMSATGLPGTGLRDTALATVAHLAGHGAARIALACNTLDVFLPELRAAVDVPVISVVEATAAAARRAGATGDRVGVLCSATTHALGLYPAALPGHEVLYPARQDRVDAAIRAGMAGRLGPDGVDDLVAELRGRGANLVVLGCTDLRSGDPTVLDGVLVLADLLAGSPVGVRS